jgi:hypothetical protein
MQLPHISLLFLIALHRSISSSLTYAKRKTLECLLDTESTQKINNDEEGGAVSNGHHSLFL